MDMQVRAVKSTPLTTNNFPNDIAQLRQQLMNQMTTLLESQSRTRLFASSISALIRRVHAELLTELQCCARQIDDKSAVTAILKKSIEDIQCLDAGFGNLVDTRQKRLEKDSTYLQGIIEQFNQTTEHLSSVLIEKDLLERQSFVLENIILSQEKVSQWKEFVQHILSGFNTIFPFNFFFIAFTEPQGLSLFFYYFGDYDDTARLEARTKMTKELLKQFNLPPEMVPDIEEFYLPGADNKITIEDIKLISVSVPDHAPGLAGLLGVAFASTAPMTTQEQSVIRSLLSVMVMVVGSSKVLQRTLSELEYYALHDPLTGIHNRRYFNDMLEYEISRSERHEHAFSILQLDLDDFKDINDSYGHPVGDEVLIKVAETICSHLRKGDIAIRMGGDEFAAILPETPPEGAKVCAEKIKATLHNTNFVSPDGKSFRISTSIGIISYPKDAQTYNDLMSGVDIALYRAKDMGKNEVCEFDPVIHQPQTLRDHRAFVEELRSALENDRIQPFFQPIIDCKTGDVFAYESVARLINVDGGIMAAGQFIETIEKYGLSRDLDRTIVKKVIAANKTQLLTKGSPHRLFINLSPQEIQGRGILGYAEDLCAKLNVPPSSIVFEILERDAIGDMSNMGKFLSNLRTKGFAFALDDFGSGYNSFHYLRELQFEYVKIDGAFIRNIVDSKIDRVLVSNLSRLCQDLGILTIGEFVESQAIMDVLTDIGIDYAQGFHLGMPRKEFI
jgi:diguanylate cyclase (GGDEF)-like protein